ncbi:MAG: sterol desaturase family protein [Bacteroidia bacterium]|nr:sterol desaturase family protein [Bacteroidia bacterium]
MSFFWTIFLPVMAGGAVTSLYLIFYVWKGTKFRKLKINPQTAPWPIMKREMGFSALSFGVFALAGYGLDEAVSNGSAAIYYEAGQYGWWYLVVSLALAFLIHDTWFYWTHRLLHWKPVYKIVHSWHHRFHNPNPFTAFAFHPLEAVVQIGIIPLVGMVLPVYHGVLVFFATFVLFMSVYGHLGFELRANKKGVFKIFNTAIHHHQHHRYFHCNYGIYFNFWDRMMKTNHATYPQAFIDFSEKVAKE